MASRPEHSPYDYDRSVTATGTRAIDVVRRAEIDHRVHVYELAERRGRARDARPAYGLEAAEALGVSPDRVYKTLVAIVDERLVLAVVPAATELDLKRLAEACGGRRAEMADPAIAMRATGYVIGGVSPLGSRRALPVVLDAGAGEHRTVFVSAGRRGLQLELAPADLVRLSGATVAHIGRDH
jgi:Cys-tRNA(Pro)/Cys-tRNA(Cys) deacylase